MNSQRARENWAKARKLMIDKKDLTPKNDRSMVFNIVNAFKSMVKKKKFRKKKKGIQYEFESIVTSNKRRKELMNRYSDLHPESIHKYAKPSTSNYEQYYKKCIPMCVPIRTDIKKAGSGVFVSKNRVVTAAHVFPDGVGEKCTLLVGTHIVRALVVAICVPLDVAVLSTGDYHHKRVCKLHPDYWNKVSPGAPVFGIHYSLGVEHATMTTGHVRTIRYQISEHALDILTDHSTHPGSSGSPIFGFLDGDPYMLGMLQYGFTKDGIALPTYGGGCCAPLIQYVLFMENRMRSSGDYSGIIPVRALKNTSVVPPGFNILTDLNAIDHSIVKSEGPIVQYNRDIHGKKGLKGHEHVYTCSKISGLRLGSVDLNNPCIHEVLYHKLSLKEEDRFVQLTIKNLMTKTLSIKMDKIVEKVGDRSFLENRTANVFSIDEE